MKKLIIIALIAIVSIASVFAAEKTVNLTTGITQATKIGFAAKAPAEGTTYKSVMADPDFGVLGEQTVANGKTLNIVAVLATNSKEQVTATISGTDFASKTTGVITTFGYTINTKDNDNGGLEIELKSEANAAAAVYNQPLAILIDTDEYSKATTADYTATLTITCTAN